jgi:hypothetical protein
MQPMNTNYGYMPPSMMDPYSPMFDLNSVDANSKLGWKQHQLRPFSAAGATALAVLVPIFVIIYYGLIHGRLPMIHPRDPSTGKAIGFFFIPIFSMVWVFMFWSRMVDRLNLQCRLRTGTIRLGKGLYISSYVASFIGMFLFVIMLMVHADSYTCYESYHGFTETYYSSCGYDDDYLVTAWVLYAIGSLVASVLMGIFIHKVQSTINEICMMDGIGPHQMMQQQMGQQPMMQQQMGQQPMMQQQMGQQPMVQQPMVQQPQVGLPQQMPPSQRPPP